MIKRKREILFFISVIFYVISVAIFIFFMKSYTKKLVINIIDNKLLNIAKTIPYILPEDYHDRAIDSKSISKSEYQKIEAKLTEIASFTGMKYIWTDIKKENKYFLTTCNKTEQTEVKGLEIYYFMPYIDGVSKEEELAFESNNPVFANFTDRWGNFRAVFVPMESPSGKKYLACAEFTMDYVQSMVNKAALFSSLTALFFFIIFIPVFMSYVYNTKIRTQELKEINEAIRKSEENLKIILNSIGDGVIVVNNEGLITIMNPVAEDLTGYKLLECQNKHLSEIICIKNYETNECIDNILEKIIHEKYTGTYNSYLILKTKSGEERIISQNGTPLFDKEKRYIGSVIVLRDITEKQRLEEQLNQSQKLESVGQLAGGIAHDFNNMLAAILGSAELLETHLRDNNELVQYVDIIVKASEKASELTRKLLAFSRKGKKKNETFDMHECIKSAIMMLGRSIDRKITIETNLNATATTVMGDMVLFENVILNIGINSRDAMPEGGIISIATSNIYYDEEFCKLSPFDIKPGEYIKIKVNDTGCGIPKQIIKKVFDPFFTTKQEGKGTGLGLSVVYGTVKDHNGFISIDSEEGKGTEITIAIPVAKPEKTKQEEILQEEISEGGTILIADDEDLIRNTLERILKSLSYSVITASEGSEAIEIIRQNANRIDAVFLDLIMPKMSGAEVLQKIREIDKQLPVIIISGFSTLSSFDEAINMGANAFLQKPFKKEDVIKTLTKIQHKGMK